MNNVNVIAFDADDTLWHTENNFQEVQRKFAGMLPILELNGAAVYIPYHITAQFEKVKNQVGHPRFHQIGSIADLPDLIRSGKTTVTAAQGRTR